MLSSNQTRWILVLCDIPLRLRPLLGEETVKTGPYPSEGCQCAGSIKGGRRDSGWVRSLSDYELPQLKEPQESLHLFTEVGQ